MILKDLLDLVWRTTGNSLIVMGEYGEVELYKGRLANIPYEFMNTEVKWFDVFKRPALSKETDEEESAMESYLTFCIKGDEE